MLMAALRREGIKLSPLFSVPGFIADFICIDVLHALDLGVTQEVIGNVLFECSGVFAVGRNRVDQVVSLLLKLQSHYKRCGTRNRISNLTVEMIKQADKRPTLRAKGRLFWGVDAMDMLAASLQNDPWFDSGTWESEGQARPGVVRRSGQA